MGVGVHWGGGGHLLRDRIANSQSRNGRVSICADVHKLPLTSSYVECTNLWRR